jgi:hypothetical protein
MKTGLDADAAVGDTNLDLGPNAFEQHVHDAAARCELDGIREQVRHHLM